MSYRLRVMNGTGSTRLTINFFDNFMRGSGFLEDDEHTIDYFLKPYKAKNCLNEPFIEFETEADATWFVLKWS